MAKRMVGTVNQWGAELLKRKKGLTFEPSMIINVGGKETVVKWNVWQEVRSQVECPDADAYKSLTGYAGD